MGLSEHLAKVTDPYERQARLYPALLAGLPVIVMATALYGTNSVITAAGSVAASCGVLYLLANIARERGKRLEPMLFESWGGKPTTQLLRHRDRTVEGPTKQRYHRFLAGKVRLEFPVEAAEAANPVFADEVYQSSIRWLLNHTRDKKNFALLFEENIAYGFRRNSYALKNIGIVTSIGSLFWVLLSQQIISRSPKGNLLLHLATASPAAVICLAVSVMMLLVWVLFFNERVVKSAAFNYAESLLRACDKPDQQL